MSRSEKSIITGRFVSKGNRVNKVNFINTSFTTISGIIRCTVRSLVFKYWSQIVVLKGFPLQVISMMLLFNLFQSWVTIVLRSFIGIDLLLVCWLPSRLLIRFPPLWKQHWSHSDMLRKDAPLVISLSMLLLSERLVIGDCNYTCSLLQSGGEWGVTLERLVMFSVK